MEVSAHLPSEVSLWIEKNINKPICGFEHKKRENGAEFSLDEQIKATRQQVRLIAYSYLQRGKLPEEILLKLHTFL